MPAVIFSHTKTREREHLTDFLEEKKWFERRKFPVFLPKSKTDIEQEILRKDKLLKHKIARLQKAWGTIEKNYFQIVRRFNYKKILPKYRCHISRFGTEGWSWSPNLFFVRLRTKNDRRRAIETIGHELLH